MLIQKYRVFITQNIVAFLVFSVFTSSVDAKDPIILHYVPEGVRLDINEDGVTDYIAYDLIQFQKLAQLDADFGYQVERIQILDEQLSLHAEALTLLEESNLMCKTELKTIQNAPVVFCPEDCTFFDQKTHLMIEGWLVVIIVGGLVYVLETK